MPKFKIEYTRDALKALKAMPRNLQVDVIGKIEQLAANPFEASNVKKLVGRDGYRLRIGAWRVIYEVDGGRLLILVLAVAPRGGAYK
ncbi:MAG: type II toxin-antitoxin system RelE/ParE family toxin [Burkholderiaceae bacterium]|nr:MAG: type II toxin-antitoxin system RelE/ParE family toxin [Burkholderiaceae bacterium]